MPHLETNSQSFTPVQTRIIQQICWVSIVCGVACLGWIGFLLKIPALAKYLCVTILALSLLFYGLAIWALNRGHHNWARTLCLQTMNAEIFVLSLTCGAASDVHLAFLCSLGAALILYFGRLHIQCLIPAVLFGVGLLLPEEGLAGPLSVQVRELIHFVAGLFSAAGLASYISSLSQFYSQALQDLEAAKAAELAVKEQQVQQAEAQLQLILRKKQQLRLANTELKQLRSAMYHQAKLVSLGTLAAGIAHELNNPLAGVKGFCQLALMESEASSCTRQKHLHAALELLQRMEHIIRHMGTMVREGDYEQLALLRLEAVLEESFRIFTTRMDQEGVAYQIENLVDSGPLFGDRSRLYSIFQNFISNSLDSFREVKDGRKSFIQLAIRNLPQNCQILYCDNAAGMESDVVNRIFDPFFTTKKVGEGMGLGMWIAHGLVRSLHGKIQVTSRPGHGTLIRIELPVFFAFQDGQRRRFLGYRKLGAAGSADKHASTYSQRKASGRDDLLKVV